VDGTALGSFPIAGFSISCIKPTGAATRVLGKGKAIPIQAVEALRVARG
jgi:hypothetical protein